MAKVNFNRILDEIEEESYFDSADFKALCVSIVALVKKAEKTRADATYRFLKENLGSNAWLFEAVEACKRAGLLYEAGSAVRTIFRSGGKAITPETSSGYSRTVSIKPKSSFGDWGVL